MNDNIIRSGEFIEANGSEVTNTRRLLVIGCGDGGCNIASAISKEIPEDSFVIAYNTSARAMEFQKSNVRIRPFGIDGSGKVRDDATNIFKKTTGRKFMEKVVDTIGQMDRIDYILVIGTADGGTGSGTAPTMAKLLASNLDTPVIIMGIYPSLLEDAMSQYNAIQWQKEVTETGLPYIILDNDQPGTITDVHTQVNNYAVTIAKLLAGRIYGNTDISIIDNRNLHMLIQQMGGRIVIASSSERMSSQISTSQHLFKLLDADYQPEPSRVKGIGIFIKGPEDMVEKMDTTLVDLQDRFGQAVLKFAHIEIADEPCISVLLSGCDEPVTRLQQIQGKYDDVINAGKNNANVASGLADHMTNPLGEIKSGTKKETLDFSALG